MFADSYLIIGQRMVVQEESGSYVKCNEDIDGIVLVSSQNEKDSEHIEQPGYGMQKVQMTWRICRKKTNLERYYHLRI